ncbi:hypothetical protein Tco_0825134 [Tanacetum coccineum]
MEEWVKKLQENAKINTRNQSASLKNLETQIEQLTKEFHMKTVSILANGQCKAVYANNEAPLNNEPYEVPTNDRIHVAQEEGIPSRILPCQLSPKELNPESFTLPCIIRSLNLYAMADLGASRPFLATIHAKIDVFNKEISLGIGHDRVTFDMDKKAHNVTTPIGKVCTMNSIRNEEENMKGGGLSFPDFLLVRYGDTQDDDLIWDSRIDGCFTIGKRKRIKVQGDDPKGSGHGKEGPKKDVISS